MRLRLGAHRGEPTVKSASPPNAAYKLRDGRRGLTGEPAAGFMQEPRRDAESESPKSEPGGRLARNGKKPRWGRASSVPAGEDEKTAGRTQG